MKKLRMPADSERFKELKAGSQVLFSGLIYTARDQAHSRLREMLSKNKPLPFSLDKKIIYYCGPAPARCGRVIGSCGPTTSARMDEFIEPLLKKGLLAMIGKGRRSCQAKKLIQKYRAIYFLAPAGCGALLSRFVSEKKMVCFPDLGPEAVYQLKVEKFPLIVGIDTGGRCVYDAKK